MTTTLANPKGSVDPVSFEVIRHRLRGIADEQAAQLMAVSGSKHVTEMSDYNVGLYLHDGAVAIMGRTSLYHSASMAALVRSVIADCTEEPGIEPGDIFAVNDPWKGTVHAPDIALLTPIFVEDRLLMWAGAMMHMPDIGGLAAGSTILASTDVYQEGLQLPPIKLVAGGVIRQDVWRMVLGNCRQPTTMNLDLRGLMAANNAAVEGLAKLVQRFGEQTVIDVMAAQVATSERLLRERLRDLPDVITTATCFLEYEPSLGEPPRVHLELRKTGEHLQFDFSKSSPQVSNSTNCTYGGLQAGIAAGLLPAIAYDIPWNAGVFHPLEVICPEGLICNARRPAAVSGNITGAVWEVEMAATVAVSKLLACSDRYLPEAQASPCGRPGSLYFFGLNQREERFGARTHDILAAGGGAYTDHDGVSSQGHHALERALISNVESLELDLPILYLRRGWAADSGGAGRQRGGSSVIGVYKPHKAKPTFQRIGRRWQVPDSFGAFGGYPGSQMGSALMRRSDVEATLASGRIPDFEGVRGDAYIVPEPPTFNLDLDHDDVIRADPPGGAGWGDPLNRPIEAVERDLAERAISPDAAQQLFGCIFLPDGRIDREATRGRREQIREERKRWPARKRLVDQPASLARLHPMGDQLEIHRDRTGALWTVCLCGTTLAANEENWRDYAGIATVAGDDLGPNVVVHDSLEVREYCCPHCGTLHAVDICRKGDPDPHDIQILIR